MDPVDDGAELRMRVPPLDDRARGEVRSSLLDLPGVADVRFVDARNEIVVVADPDVVSDDELLAAIGEAGVEARPA